MLGAIVLVIVVMAAALYFFYTKLASTKARLDSVERKANDAANTAKTANMDKIGALDAKVQALESKVKKLKKPEKKVRCDDNSCTIDTE